MPKSSFNSSESGIGQDESLHSNRKQFFTDFVPQLEAFFRRPGDPDDPLESSVDDRRPVPQKKPRSQQQQQQQQQQLAHRPKMIMAKSTEGGNMIHRESPKTDPSMYEIELIVDHLKSGGPYCEKLVNIMLKGMEKSWPHFYKIFCETGVPDNFCPIVKMNNDNTPYVEFLIKADTADQDPFAQLNGYTAEYMALCKFVVDRLFQDAPHKRQDITPPPAKKPPMLQQNLQQNPQQRQQQQQQSQQYWPRQQPKKSLDQTFGVPLACSTPKSQRHRILPPRACKSMNRSDLQN